MNTEYILFFLVLVSYLYILNEENVNILNHTIEIYETKFNKIHEQYKTDMQDIVLYYEIIKIQNSKINDCKSEIKKLKDINFNLTLFTNIDNDIKNNIGRLQYILLLSNNTKK